MKSQIFFLRATIFLLTMTLVIDIDLGGNLLSHLNQLWVFWSSGAGLEGTDIMSVFFSDSFFSMVMLCCVVRINYSFWIDRHFMSWRSVTLNGASSCIWGRQIDVLGPFRRKFPPMALDVLYPYMCVLLYPHCTHVLILENLSYRRVCIFLNPLSCLCVHASQVLWRGHVLWEECWTTKKQDVQIMSTFEMDECKYT